MGPMVWEEEGPGPVLKISKIEVVMQLFIYVLELLIVGDFIFGFKGLTSFFDLVFFLLNKFVF